MRRQDRQPGELLRCVDKFNTFGLGKDVPIAMGNQQRDSRAGRRSSTASRCPIDGFFPKNVDGRIDDPNGGWKGKSLWSTYGQRTMFHLEGGKENRPRAVRFQLRPDPLAH
jgi:hypothetical protein